MPGSLFREGSMSPGHPCAGCASGRPLLLPSKVAMGGPLYNIPARLKAMQAESLGA